MKVILATALMLATSVTVVAQTKPSVESKPVLTPTKEPPETVIRLNSEEWVRGRVEYMNYGRIYFNSRKFDRVDFAWDDVHLLLSTETHEYVFRDDTKLRGLARIDRETVRLDLGDGNPLDFPRRDLLAIYPGQRGLGNMRWFGKISASYETVSGNTDETTFDLFADITDRAGSLEVRFRANAAFSDTDGSETRKKNDGTVQANYDLNRWFYLIPGRLQVDYDKFENIGRRFRGAVGAGVNLLRENQLVWRLEGGPGYEETRFRRVEPGEDRAEAHGMAYVGTHFRWDITGDIDVTSDFGAYLVSGSYTFNWRSTLSIEVISDFDIDFTSVWDRNGDPQRDDVGESPDKNDFRFMVGIGWVF